MGLIYGGLYVELHDEAGYKMHVEVDVYLRVGDSIATVMAIAIGFDCFMVVAHIVV